MTYPGFDADVARANEHYRITDEVCWNDSCYLEADAGNGSRIAVIATRLPYQVRAALGGACLVTAYYPTKTSYAFTGLSDMSYVAEKFWGWQVPVNGGDLYALTRTINTALERITS